MYPLLSLWEVSDAQTGAMLRLFLSRGVSRPVTSCQLGIMPVAWHLLFGIVSKDPCRDG